MASQPPRQRFVSVSNGIEFLLIPRSSLDEAEANGYYRPESRGRTIVEKDGRLFEVPLTQAAATVGDGYRDLLIRERRASAPTPVPAADPISMPPLTSTAQPVVDAVAALESLLPPAVPSIATSQANPPNEFDANSVDVDSLVQAIEQAQREEEELRLEQQRQIEAAPSWRQPWLRVVFWIATRRATLVRQISVNGVSLAVHLAVVLMLASLFLVNQKAEELVLMVSPGTSESVVEEFTFEPESVEITEPTETEPAESAPVSEAVPEMAEVMPSPDFSGAINGEAVQLASLASTTPGLGMAKSVAKPTIFGSKFAAINYVFVIDNSNSMTRGRFETALIQLMLTVTQLTPKQRFYVIFYSDTAYGMMHPKTVPNLVPATKGNKVLLGQWLDTVPLCLKTNGRKAIQMAIDLKPDAIYVLGDGAFTDQAAKVFAAQPTPSIIINTLGMEVKPSDAEQFKLLATTHRGTYRDVGVMPEGAEMAKRFPRPRNSVRGPIWGITLPPANK